MGNPTLQQGNVAQSTPSRLPSSSVVCHHSPMKRLLLFPVLFLTLLVGNPVFSADFQKGLKAYQQGDYATALKEWKPLAEQGDDHDQLKLGLMYAILEDYVYAHMWFNVSVLAGNKKAVKQREMVSRKMTPSQITKAQRLASEYVKKNYKRPKVERKEKPTLFLR